MASNHLYGVLVKEVWFKAPMAKDGQGQVIVGRYDPGNMFHRDKITSPPVTVEHNPVRCAWVKIGPEEGYGQKVWDLGQYVLFSASCKSLTVCKLMRQFLEPLCRSIFNGLKPGTKKTILKRLSGRKPTKVQWCMVLQFAARFC